MINSTQKTARELSIEKGKKIVIAVFVLFALMEVLGLILKLTNQRPISFVDLFRVSLTIVCCIFLYKGHNWARLILVVSVSLELLAYVYTLYRMIMSHPVSVVNFIIILCLAIISAVAIYYLLFSSDVEEFRKSRKR